ncbi:hypothetical protein EYF80_048411 [Liparis tanakae]|uniref:Uncharacterized protein n=1 Tax=Liparis tanakae TaxID=230148 RepID=A0A4Z2FJN9_9TELE|nr:hypothetical protein EYF80_048411 [Liparis tanakae]
MKQLAAKETVRSSTLCMQRWMRYQRQINSKILEGLPVLGPANARQPSMPGRCRRGNGTCSSVNVHLAFGKEENRLQGDGWVGVGKEWVTSGLPDPGFFCWTHREKVCSYLWLGDRDVDRLSINQTIGKSPWAAGRKHGSQSEREACGAVRLALKCSPGPPDAMLLRHVHATPPSREPPRSRWRNTGPHRHAAHRPRPSPWHADFTRQLAHPVGKGSR